MRTTLQTRNEIGVYNYILNGFIKTFELQIFNEKYLLNYKIKELRDYHEIKEELHIKLISLKPLIIEYAKDYKRWKSVEHISKKTNIDVEIIIDYLNTKKTIVTGLTEDEYPALIETYKIFNCILKLYEGKVVKETEIKMISSYQIMKEIQLNHRYSAIKNPCSTKS